MQGAEVIMHCAGSSKGDEQKTRTLVSAAKDARHIVVIPGPPDLDAGSRWHQRRAGRECALVPRFAWLPARCTRLMHGSGRLAGLWYTDGHGPKGTGRGRKP